MKRDGIYLSNVPTLDLIISREKIKLRDAVPKVEKPLLLRELVEARKIRLVVDRYYPLEQTAEAFRYVEEGHKKGNVVIPLEPNSRLRR